MTRFSCHNHAVFHTRQKRRDFVLCTGHQVLPKVLFPKVIKNDNKAKSYYHLFAVLVITVDYSSWCEWLLFRNHNRQNLSIVLPKYGRIINRHFSEIMTICKMWRIPIYTLDGIYFWLWLSIPVILVSLIIIERLFYNGDFSQKEKHWSIFQCFM